MKVNHITRVIPYLCDGACGLKATHTLNYNRHDDKLHFCDDCFEQLKKAIKAKVTK